MFKRVAIIVFLVFFSLEVFSQSAQSDPDRNVFYDASYLNTTFLAKNKKIGTTTADRALLDYYFKTQGMSQKKIDSIISKNPFFDNTIYQSGGAQGLLQTTNAPGLFGSGGIGGLDVTNFATGIANLLIDRAKQELTIAFFNRFKAYAKDPNHPEFITLFPQTTEKLDSLLSYEYPKMLPALRSAFFADMKQITFHLEALLELPKYKNFIQNFPEVIIAIKSIKIVHDIEDGTSNAADVIKTLASDSFVNWQVGSNVFKNTGSLLKLASIISESLRDTLNNPNSNIWIPSQQLKGLVTDSKFSTVYMGLIYQEIKNSNQGNGLKYFKDTTSLDIATSFSSQKANILLFQNKLSEFINLTTKVNTVLAANRAKENLTNEDYYNYINVSLDAIDYSFSIVKIFDTTFNHYNVLTIPRKANSLYKDIYSQQYTQAVSDGIDILTQIKVLVDASPTNDRQNTNFDQLVTFAVKVKPYAIFMANVIEAKTPADIESALNNAILPVGSYTIKQTSACNISLNGYIGYAFDYNAFGPSNLYANGIYAPIGFSFTHTFTKLPVTIFFSVIDVGSIVSYQLSNPSSTTTGTSTTSLSQQIKLASIFSPSAHLLFEIPKTPIAFGVGWRRTPTLYYSNGPNYATVPARSVFNATALIDIPFFTLHNKALK